MVKTTLDKAREVDRALHSYELDQILLAREVETAALDLRDALSGTREAADKLEAIEQAPRATLAALDDAGEAIDALFAAVEPTLALLDNYVKELRK